MTHKLFRFIFTLTLAAVCFALPAQQLTIQGTVFDDTGYALPGVTIYNKEKITTGAVTDINGKFSIRALRGDWLVFSYAGFYSHECLVNGETSNLTVSLYGGKKSSPHNPVTTVPASKSDSVWRKIDEMTNPKEALDVIQKIYRTALNENDYGRVINAIVCRMKRQTQFQENTTAALLDSLKLDAERLPQPAKSVVYSLMADVFRTHNKSNQHTRTTDVSDDVLTRDISRLFEEALKYYKLSIQDGKILQQTPVDEYSEALFYVFEKDKKKLALPTLYDLLVFRAILAYSRELSAVLPQQTFVVNQPAYFADARTFTEYPIPATDTLSAGYQVISLYQKLLHFRLQQPDDADNRYALVNIDIERLRYVQNRGINAGKDMMYEKAMKEWIDKYQAYPEKCYPMYALAMHYKNQASNWRNSKKDELRRKYRDAYRLCEDIISASGDTLLISSARDLQDEIKNPSATLKLNYLQYPDAPVLAHVTYRNINKLYLYFYRLTDEEAVKYHRQWHFNDFNPASSGLFRTQTIDLPSQPDYQEYSTEIKLDALPQGIYIVLASDVPDLSREGIREHSGKLTAGALFQVSSLAVAVSNGPKNTDDNRQDEEAPMYTSGKPVIHVFLADSKTGEPVKDGMIQYYCGWDHSTLTLIGSYNTDQHGMVHFPQQHDSRTFIKMVAVHKGSRFVFFSGFYNLPVNRPSLPEVVFFTDRAIYRPGQTVYYKALCFENQQLLNDFPLTIDFRDVNRKTITSHELTTGEYGTVQGNFVIPQGLLNGEMSLVCKIGNRESQCSFRVEEYKRPTFELVYDPIEENFRLNDSVRVSGKANALAGYVVDHARVIYRVVRNGQPRYRYWWTPPVQVSSQREITSGTTVTRNDGSFTITFKAEADDVRNDALIYQYTVTADITDVNGETRSASQAVKISAKPVLLETGIPEKIINRDQLDFKLTTTNLNGDFTPADVTVTLTGLKSPSRILHDRLWAMPDTFTLSRAEFENSFPFDAYSDDGHPDKFPVVRQIASFQLNTANDETIRLHELKTAKAGWYRLDLKARTPDNVTVEEQKMYVQLLGAPDEKNAPVSLMKDWVTNTRNNNLYEAGENMEFLIAGGCARSFVYYEVISDNRVVEQKSITTGATPRRLLIPVKEAYRGGVSVQFVMIQNQRVYHKNENINVPYSNKQLDVAFTTFRDKLQPGEQEQWTLSVKNKNGEKEMAELVATLYDASLDMFSPLYWANSNNFHKTRYPYFGNWQLPGNLSVRTSSYLYQKNKFAGVFQPVFPALLSYPSFSERNIEEVIIAGLGTTRRRAGLTEIVEQEEILYAMVEDKPAPAAFTGRSAGLVSARPTDEIRIRGLGTSDANSGALVLIDGIEGDINSVNPANIESISVLKDAPATAVFGVRGANGVILINTKKEKNATRRNFNETAFFYPQLRTGENGETVIGFTVPEALTRWKMLGFAHTKDLKAGNISAELVTQKQVAISANAPRFFREGDIIEFTAKVNNIAGENLSGQAMLRLYDATNMQPADAKIIRSSQTQIFNVRAGESTGVKWSLAIPEGIQAITYKVTAQAGNHTDGEEKTVPVLANTMLVTETMPFSVRRSEKKTFTFKQMKDNNSTTLRNHRLTLEFTSNPAWYVVQAMPYMMEYPYDCAEQVFTRFYANSLGATIVNSLPRIREIFDLWRNPSSDPFPKERKEALLSDLGKNQEMKQVLLEETPWVMQAASETERKKRVGLLFDLNRMGYGQQGAFDKLQKMQLIDGGFPWFAGLPANRFITQHIVAGFGHLQALNALDKDFSAKANYIVNRAFFFMDDCIGNDYSNLLKMNNADLSKQHITPAGLHYLYACSFTKHQPNSNAQREAFEFYRNQAVLYWKNFNLYEQAMTALALYRYGDTETASAVINSLKGRALNPEETGMYWKDNVAGYFWHQAPVETQAMLIEAFNEVANDSASVEEMKIWLLRHKQTNDWGTTKATAEACYALLMTGDKLLDESLILDVKIGGKPLASIAEEEIHPEPGTGYVKTSWNESDISKDMAVLDVINPNKSGIAWGGVFWQYFEQLDKIAAAETNLRMNKQLFLKQMTGRGFELTSINGQNPLKVGDIVTVRMELHAGRDYEYVHLKDMRAAGFEPVKTLSGHRYQDGLWFYESIRDASTNFFITSLRKGTYVFEYELRVTHAGEFSNGITTFRCMYAPEFSAHSEGERVKVQ